MSWAARRLDDVPVVSRASMHDPIWHPVQHFFGLTAFGANVFVAERGDETLVEAHDEQASGQEELYLVLAGSAAFELDGEAILARQGTLVAVTDPAVRRRAAATAPGTSLLVVGTRPGCFETTWRGSHFADVPRAGG